MQLTNGYLLGATQRSQTEIEMTTVNKPTISQLTDIYPPSFNGVPLNGRSIGAAQEDMHAQLLEYLLGLLDSDTDRKARIQRYAYADKLVSTHQKLSPEDTKRKAKEMAEGKMQAISMNLPITTTYLEDTCSFFTEIYAPASGVYYSTPKDPETARGLRAMLEKLNEDSAAGDYYVELLNCVRSLLKYNIGGFISEWLADELEIDSPGQAIGMNCAQALDMYNLFWDPTIVDPRKLRLKGEWFAIAEIVNRKHLVDNELIGNYYGIVVGLDEDMFNSGSRAPNVKYYRYPPVHANVAGEDSGSGELGQYAVDWDAYGASLTAGAITIPNAYELITMYAWLNPNDYGLSAAGDGTPVADGYYLWKFKILGGKRIVSATPALMSDDSTAMRSLPIYMSFMHNDDMKMATRSTGELILPFQRFISFLLNAHIEGARNAIYGLQVYDPSMVDMSKIEGGVGMVGRVQSKVPGRDVRTGIHDIKGNYDTSNTMGQVANMSNLLKEYFPSQALPTQIAGMDRAVQSQVAEVKQGATRRMHMLVRALDSAIFNPMRFDQYRQNIAAGVPVEGITDKKAREALGSGLAQLTREVMESSVRNILQTMIGNPAFLEQYDVASIFAYWGSLLNVPVDVQAFKLQPNQNPALQTDTNPQPTADSGQPTLPGIV